MLQDSRCFKQDHRSHWDIWFEGKRSAEVFWSILLLLNAYKWTTPCSAEPQEYFTSVCTLSTPFPPSYWSYTQHHSSDSAHLELKALPVAPTETRVVPELKCRFVEDWIPPLPSELWSLPSEWQQPTQEDKNAFLSVLFIFQISFVSTILWESLLQLCTPFVRQESIKFK